MKTFYEERTTDKSKRMATYLVTGGAGFIGSHTVEALVKQGAKVRVLDNFSTGKRENLSAIRQPIELIEGDIRDPLLCQRAMEKTEYVIHLAAFHEVPRSVQQPFEVHDINLTGLMNLLLAARGRGVKRFIFASSSAVYGDSPVLPRSEETIPFPMTSPYAVTKFAGEYYCQLFTHLYGLETVCLRYFNVYGPRQDLASDYAGVIPKFISALLAESAPTIYGDGEQSRDFTYVGDGVAATLQACHCPSVAGKVLNIGTGRQTTVKQLLSLLQNILRRKIPPQFQPPQPGEVRHDQADIEMAKRLLSYHPEWDLPQGLAETVAWYMKNG